MSAATVRTGGSPSREGSRPVITERAVPVDVDARICTITLVVRIPASTSNAPREPKVSDYPALHIPLVQTYGLDFLFNPAERLKCAQQISASVRDLMMLELQTGANLLWDRDVIALR